MVLHTRGRVGSRRFQQDPSEEILEGLLRCVCTGGDKGERGDRERERGGECGAV